jgi:hypothetical protein
MLSTWILRVKTMIGQLCAAVAIICLSAPAYAETCVTDTAEAEPHLANG